MSFKKSYIEFLPQVFQWRFNSVGFSIMQVYSGYPPLHWPYIVDSILNLYQPSANIPNVQQVCAHTRSGSNNLKWLQIFVRNSGDINVQNIYLTIYV